LPSDKLNEAMQFVVEWTPSFDTLGMISELEDYKIKAKVTN